MASWPMAAGGPRILGASHEDAPTPGDDEVPTERCPDSLDRNELNKVPEAAGDEDFPDVYVQDIGVILG